MGSLVNVLNPEIIVLGGGLVEAIPGLIVREAGSAADARACHDANSLRNVESLSCQNWRLL